MEEQLSNFRIKQGRSVFNAYNGINSFSFALVTGNTITLYALALKANSTVIGLLTAFMYMCYFTIPLGKLMARRFTIVKTFAYTWFLRNASLLPILFIPLFYFRGENEAAIFMLLLAVALFNFFRGAGIVANNPVISLLAPGKDRNSYIVKISLTNNAAALAAIIFLTVFLWFSPRFGIDIVSTYNITAIIGIITGFAASALLLKLPDPDFERRMEAVKEARVEGRSRKEIRKLKRGNQNLQKGSFFSASKEAFGDKNFKLYIFSFFIIQFGISLARPFIIVYGKAVYSIPDNLVIIFSLASTMGSLLVGLLMRLLIDRMGAKPMYVIFTALSAAALIPAIIAPAREIYLIAFIFLIVFSMITNMGFSAQMDASQAYFFGIVPSKSLMDLSMLNFFVMGLTGALGSILGGRILDMLQTSGFSNLSMYRIFFLCVIACILFGMIFQIRLLNLGGRLVKDALAVIFSPRDMKALNLLYKLDSSESLQTEEKILHELTATASQESADKLNQYMRSPRFSIRYSAMDALNSLEKLSAKNRETLLEELNKGEFTTAALAAKTLAHFNVHQAVEPLRKALESKDYLLSGEAMIALAHLKDEASQFKISQILSETKNPKILLSGIKAMETYRSVNSIPFIIDLLRREGLPSLVEDEAYLSLASMMKVEGGFYFAYDRFKNEARDTGPIFTDMLDEAFAKRKKSDLEFKKIILTFISEASNDTEFIKWFLDLAEKFLGVNSALLLSVIMDVDMVTNKSFRFFLCYWAVSIFMEPKLAEI